MSLGDDADGEKLARRLGSEKMNQLNEAFEEIGYIIELEPEWHFGDLSSNPDIHSTPPTSVKDALEQVKPFLMEYENIQSQEEWEVCLWAFRFSLHCVWMGFESQYYSVWFAIHFISISSQWFNKNEYGLYNNHIFYAINKYSLLPHIVVVV